MIGVAVLATAAALVLWPNQSEPEYQGKPLTHWLTNGAPWASSQMENAIRACGSNAIPWMLKQIDYNPSSLRIKLDRWIAKRPTILRQSLLGRNLRIDPKWRINRGWMPFYFGVLGVEGTSAVPDLTRMACAGNREALLALVCMREHGVPGLIQILDQGGRVNRANVVRNIGYTPWFRTNATFVAAALRHVQDSDAEVACAAAQVVADEHIEAPTTMPSLIEGLNHAHPTVRRMCAYTLSAYGAEAQPALPALKVLLADPDAAVREDATNAIRLIEQ